MVVPQQTG